MPESEADLFDFLVALLGAEASPTSVSSRRRPCLSQRFVESRQDGLRWATGAGAPFPHLTHALTTMNEKESSLESRRQDTPHPRVGGFDCQTLTDICLEVDLKSYNKYLPAGHRHRAPKFSLNVNRCIFVCFPMFGPSSVAGAPSNMQKAIENMCFDNFGVWTKEL